MLDVHTLTAIDLVMVNTIESNTLITHHLLVLPLGFASLRKFA